MTRKFHSNFRHPFQIMASIRHVNLIPKIGGMPIGASIALGGHPVANIRLGLNPFSCVVRGKLAKALCLYQINLFGPPYTGPEIVLHKFTP